MVRNYTNTNRFAIGRPIPTLRAERVLNAGVCPRATTLLKSRKSASWVTPAGSPQPSSVTENVIMPRADTETRTTIPVAHEDEYFTAFVSPFKMIWRSRPPSVFIWRPPSQHHLYHHHQTPRGDVLRTSLGTSLSTVTVTGTTAALFTCAHCNIVPVSDRGKRTHTLLLSQHTPAPRTTRQPIALTRPPS